jgi:hypothetical protein
MSFFWRKKEIRWLIGTIYAELSNDDNTHAKENEHERFSFLFLTKKTTMAHKRPTARPHIHPFISSLIIFCMQIESSSRLEEFFPEINNKRRKEKGKKISPLFSRN